MYLSFAIARVFYGHDWVIFFICSCCCCCSSSIPFRLLLLLFIGLLFAIYLFCCLQFIFGSFSVFGRLWCSMWSNCLRVPMTTKWWHPSQQKHFARTSVAPTNFLDRIIPLRLVSRTHTTNFAFTYRFQLQWFGFSSHCCCLWYYYDASSEHVTKYTPEVKWIPRTRTEE